MTEMVTYRQDVNVYSRSDRFVTVDIRYYVAFWNNGCIYTVLFNLSSFIV